LQNGIKIKEFFRGANKFTLDDTNVNRFQRAEPSWEKFY